MGKINAYYPVGTKKIIHHGKSGNSYYLDAISIPLGIHEGLNDNSSVNIVSVNNPDGSILLNSHSQELLEAYKTGNPMDLAESSGLKWNNDFYQYVVNTAWTSIRAFEEALKNGKSIAITAGGHHAEYEKGLGFGPISNMVIAAKELLKNGEVNRIAILDLDVHFANGTHSLVQDEINILSCDLWKYKLTKWKYTPNSKNIYHQKVDKKKDYFIKLNKVFERIVGFGPNLVVVMNGLDVLDSDRMGGIQDFNESALNKRSKLVGNFISKNKYPVAVFTGGGYIDYSKPSGEIEISKDKLTQLYIKSIFSIINCEKKKTATDRN